MEFARRYYRPTTLGLLFLFAAFICYAVVRESRGRTLTVAFLDVGQGDAIYIEAPSGNQMLIDGGPPKKLSPVLSSVMPFYDRSIDAILVSNPDQDHIGGFLDVLKNYKVGMLIEPGTKPETAAYKKLEQMADESGVKKIIGRRGMRVNLGSGVSFSILFPDRDASGMKTNEGSIVGKLAYGANSILFTGDSPSSVEHYLVSLDSRALRSDVLKVGHHGSKTSTSPELVGYVSPKTAVISVGKGNSYGHPNKETLDTLNRFGVKILRTDEAGTVVMRLDGEAMTVQ